MILKYHCHLWQTANCFSFVAYMLVKIFYQCVRVVRKWTNTAKTILGLPSAEENCLLSWNSKGQICNAGQAGLSQCGESLEGEGRPGALVGQSVYVRECSPFPCTQTVVAYFWGPLHFPPLYEHMNFSQLSAVAEDKMAWANPYRLRSICPGCYWGCKGEKNTEQVKGAHNVRLSAFATSPQKRGRKDRTYVDQLKQL